MRTSILLIYLSIIVSPSYQVGAQINNEIKILVGANIIVGTEESPWQIIEPHLAAHPNNPNHLIAVGTVYSTRETNVGFEIGYCAAFITYDGGKTWERKGLPAQVGLDSWVSITEDFALITTLGNDTSTSDYDKSLYQLLLYSSADGGKTWEKAKSLGNYHDGPRTTVAEDGTVYLASHQAFENVVSKIFVAKTVNGSHMERKSTVIPSYLNNAMDGITTYFDGSLAIAFQDFQRPVSGARKDENGNWRGSLKTRREWVIISEDNDGTFSEPRLISEKFYDRANDLIADKTNSEFRDRLYCIGSSINYKSLLITFSDDKGRTWTDERQIEPDSLFGIRKEPQLAINRDGILGVAWLDSRDYGENDYTGLCYNVYMCFSADGGKTFTDPVRISKEKSCVNPEVAGKYVSRRWREGGDYFGLATSSDGKFHVVWPDARSGKFELITSCIDVRWNRGN